ncbi:MAG: hypothetical protein ACLFU3_08565 [Dichotomicrobium sp.]
MPFRKRGEGAVRRLKDAPKRYEIGINAAAHMAGQVLVRQVHKGMINETKSGRIYAHPKGGTYRASAPGQYSASVTHALLRSVDYVVPNSNYLWFGAGAPHAVFQELGTSKMQPRPNLGNAVRDTSQEVRSILGQITFKRIVGA